MGSLCIIYVSCAIIVARANAQLYGSQSTEPTRLFGTYNVNRNTPYDDRNRYGLYAYNATPVGSSSGSGSVRDKRPPDTIYWEQKAPLRDQTDPDRDRFYSSNWNSNNNNERYSSTYERYNPLYEKNNPGFDRLNLNYGASSPSSSTYDRDRGAAGSWDREKEREREREREYDRERNYYLNSRRIPLNTNTGTNTNYGQNQPRTKLPGCGAFDEWRPDLMGQCRPDYAANVNDRDVFVTTPYGRIRGFLTQLFDGPGVPYGDRPGVYHAGKLWRTVSTFLGIPYATPPVAEGRFKPPRPKRAWSLWDATDFGPACPQPVQYVGASKGIRYMNEDCLYLNVFTPTTGAVAEKYPVIFYIHGGDFERGASNTFPGHMLATVGEVVVVTVNYRLGALGFLSTGDEYSPGNYGMLDLTMALTWVYDNIYAFNGNKDFITVYGPGSGAAAAGLLAVAPKTQHMVRQVIAQSGSALADWASVQDLYRLQNTSRVYGERLGCLVDKPYKLIDCLRSRSFEELGNVKFSPDVGFWPWVPAVDREIRKPSSNWYEGWEEKDWTFLPEVPEELVRTRQYSSQFRYLSGVTKDEAAYLVFNNKTLLPNFEITQAFFDLKIREYIHKYNYTLNPEGIFNAIKYMYTYWPDPRNTTHIREQYINFMSDALYRSPNDKMVKMLTEEGVPTFMYVLNSTINALNYPLWSRVPHNIEYFFLTGAPFMDPEFFPEDFRIERNKWTEEDRQMSEFLLRTFANFARFGRPTPVAIYNINWPQMRHGILEYLNLNRTDNSTIEFNYRQQECAFWSEYMPSVVGFLLPTYRPFTEYWWEPTTPISIAFWSVSGACVILAILSILCCCLWRGAKKANDKLLAENYLSDELIENHHTTGSRDYNNSPRFAPSRSAEKLKLQEAQTSV